MNKLFSLVLCGALLTLPLAMGCNNTTEPEPIGVDAPPADGAVEEVDMEQE